MRISAEKHLAEHHQLVFSLCGKVSSSYTMPHMGLWDDAPSTRVAVPQVAAATSVMASARSVTVFGFCETAAAHPDRVTERCGCMQGVGGPVKRVARCPEGPAPRLVPDVAKKHHVKWSPEVIDYEFLAIVPSRH